MALAGTVFGGRYELAEQIGNGGYCEVWCATDTLLSRLVAVKLLHPGYARKAEALARFQAEARHAGALSHANIARVLDYGEPADAQPPYLVMELVDGPSLEDLLADGPLDATRSMDIIAQAAAGLRAAHAEGLVHRDVKPANILLASGRIVKVTDFGIAHAVGSAAVTPIGEMVGTPGYLSPEQVAGGQATPASDLYALGVVAYECLVGEPPFAGMPLEITVAHRDRPLPPLPSSVPADVAAFVTHLTAKDPGRRPGSADEVALTAGRLRDGLSAGGYGEPHPSPEARAEASVTAEPDQGPHAGRRQRTLALATLVLAVLTATVVASIAGFAPGWHQASVPSSTPSGPSPTTVAPVRTAANPHPSLGGRKPAASLAAQPTLGQSAVTTSGKLGHKRGQGHGNGQGNGNGKAVGASG